MKLSVFTALFMCCVIGANAQRKGLYQCPQISYGESRLINKAPNNYQYQNFQRSNCYSAGFNSGCMMNDHHGIFIGLGYAQYKWANMYGKRQVQNFVNLNLNYKFFSSKAGKVGLVADLGCKLGLLVKGTYSVNFINYQSGKIENTSDFHRFLCAPYVFLGLNIPVGKRFDIIMGVESEYNVVNTFALPNQLAHLTQRSFKIGLGIHSMLKSFRF